MQRRKVTEYRAQRLVMLLFQGEHHTSSKEVITRNERYKIPKMKEDSRPAIIEVFN
jgi:hypothetical protein